ncbi:uncharacterized protein LOC135220011 [Macrobrachium nipponense]|uniref:uncharacterized protein LOC135220011 n=1 Tax=Macrobrachium nipponense TaxID=159736 RepID=UPI0030C8692C
MANRPSDSRAEPPSRRRSRQLAGLTLENEDTSSPKPSTPELNRETCVASRGEGDRALNTANDPNIHDDRDPLREFCHGLTTQNSIVDQAPASDLGGSETVTQRGDGGGREASLELNLQNERDNNIVSILDYSAPVGSHIDIISAVQRNESIITKDVIRTFEKFKTYSGKIYLSLTISIEKLTDNDVETSRFYVNSPPALIEKARIHELFDVAIDYLTNVLEDRLSGCEGSGWRIYALEKLAVIYSRFKLVNIQKFIKFPKGLRGSHQIVNIESGYNCLITCLQAYKDLAENPRKRKDNLTRTVKTKIGNGKIDIKYDPSAEVNLNTLKEIERLNDFNIYIYKLSGVRTETSDKNKQTIHLFRRGGNPTSSHRVTLLIIGDDHVALIKNLIRFVYSFCNGSIPRKKKICGICYKCLTFFTSPDIEQCHTQMCCARTTVKYPDPGQFKSFKKVQALQKISHVAFLDLEAYNVNPGADEDPRIVTKQKAYAFCYVIVDARSGRYRKHRLGHGDDCINAMLDHLKKDWAEIQKAIPKYEIKMTTQSTQEHEKASHCQTCHEKFSGEVKKVRHHAHHIPEDNYAGALCSKCNIKIVDKPKTLRVFVHNLSYDICLILKESCPKIYFNVLKRDGGKYYSAQTGCIKFVDSGNMIRGSLASLSSTHISQDGSLKITRALLSSYPDEGKKLVLNTGKQFYPYDYVTGYEILNEPGIPPIASFNSKLSGEKMTAEGYEHVKKVWEAFKCKTLLDYSLLYLLMDVGLLADVYMSWRNAAFDQFKLDPAHYLTSTSLSLDAFLHSSEVCLPLISNGELYQLITSNIRGGFCSLVRRHAIASNPHVNPQFKEHDKQTYILYVDFTSLYPTVMSEYKMPLDVITELEPAELREFIGRDITTIDSQGEYGYFILCDTKKLRDDVAIDTDDFPLALHHMNIGKEHVSQYTSDLLSKFKVKLTKNNVKLVGTHLPMKNHLICLPLLQTLVKLGLEIESIKKVYKFRQDFYLRDYIMENAAQRAKETDPDKKNTIKILMNGLFGVTIKNSLNYATKTVVVSNKDSLLRNVSKHTYKSLDMIDEKRFIINHNRETVLADSPIYIGFSVLDLAKDKMYKFYYNVLRAHYGDRVQLLYMDTDSFFFSLETDDLTRELKGPLHQHLDLSNFPKTHPLYDSTRKGKLGLVKIETGAEYIREFVGIKPKVYSYLTETSRCNTLKGVKKATQKTISHEQYKEIIDKNEIFPMNQHSLLSVKGTMCLTKQKTALCPLEDKRYYIDAYNSYAYGHPEVERDMARRGRGKVITSINGKEGEVEEEKEEERKRKRKRRRRKW